MSHSKPFHRNYRAFVPSQNSGYSQWAYIVDRDYAQAPEHYVRTFLLIQQDLKKLFEFVEPADTNLDTYSFRIHELFMRTCIEVEANCKAILKENIYNPVDSQGRAIPEKRWNIHNYRKVNKSHRLSSYKVHIPIWEGNQSSFDPFKEWDSGTDKSKHDRQAEFKEANLKNLLNAISGLLALLSSQFGTQDFSPVSTGLSVSVDSYYSTSPALGSFFHVDFPSDWPTNELYDFDWSSLKSNPNRFDKINYDNL
jgi:hypothetical protein